MKKLPLGLCTALICTGASFLPMSTNAMLPLMQADAGYNYNTAKDGLHSAHIEIAPWKKFVVGAEYRHWNNNGNEADIYAKYRVGHVYVGLGNRNYINDQSKVYGLIEGKTKLVGPLGAYAGVKLSEREREYKVGLQLDLIPSSFDLDFNYTYFDKKNDEKNPKGFGFGLNYSF